MKLSAAILAGGSSSRMQGLDKTMLCIDGETVIEKQTKILHPIFNEVFIAGKTNGNIIPDVPVYNDFSVSSCPLSGIYTALKKARNPYIFIVSCDMPFLSSNLIQLMIKEIQENTCDILIPKHDVGLEPLHAIYSVRLIPFAKELLNDGSAPISALFKNAVVKFYDIPKIFEPDEVFFNINYPHDLLKAIAHAKRNN